MKLLHTLKTRSTHLGDNGIEWQGDIAANELCKDTGNQKDMS